ncbi:MAG TPA: IS4 family transposase [Flavitalea sp.]|nr:IS4 family transposase [Flavitalea sp.]
MFDVNVKIIAELKNFITIVCSNRDILKKFCISDRNFIRTRKLPFERLALVIARLCKKTLSIELEKFFEEMGCSMNCSVSAFTQQRLKLEPDFFYLWNMVLWGSYYLYYGKAVKRWKDYRVIAADGSSISLINNESLSKHFGGQSNQQTNFVLAKTFYHYDVLNELILLPQIKPYRYGELNMAYDAIDKIAEDMLTIYDRNFSNYKMVALHLWQEKERKFVIRAKETQNMIKAFIRSGKKSSIVYMQPTISAIEGLKKSGFIITKDTLIKVRLVRVDLRQSTEILITNLWEEDGHRAEEFKDLYFMRWGVETNISLQKNILQLESFSGLSAHCVLQDFYATVMMSNLHSILIKDAQQTIEDTMQHRKYPMKVNKNKSFGKFKVNLVSLFVNNDTEAVLRKLHDHFVRDVIPIRKGRSFKRVKKNIQSKSKHKTFTNFKPSY